MCNKIESWDDPSYMDGQDAFWASINKRPHAGLPEDSKKALRWSQGFCDAAYDLVSYGQEE